MALSTHFRFVPFMVALAASGIGRAQAPVAEQPSQAVHLLLLDAYNPNAEAVVRSAVTGINQAIVKAGCAACTYHLWKVVDAAPGSYNYVQTSTWPSKAMYEKVHTSPDYLAASGNWQTLRAVVMKEVYNRYAEIDLSK